MKEKIRDNGEKIKQNKVLPYLVSNVVEVCLVWVMSVRYFLKPYCRFLNSTQRGRKMVPTRMLMRLEKANAL